MNIIIFGTGDYYRRYKRWVEHEKIVCLLDNDKNKQGQKDNGISIISPENINNYKYDFVVILSFQYKSMKQQLLELNVNEDKIIGFYSLRKIIDWKKWPQNIKWYEPQSIAKKINKKKTLLLSPELNNGGPAIALYHVGEVLKNNNYEVTVGSMIDGELREVYLKKGITVVVDNNLQLATMSEIDWVNQYDLIICNTLNYYVFLTERNTNLQIIWWLHEASFFYEGIDKESFKHIPSENLRIVSVGDIPRKAFFCYNKNFKINDLLYCVEEQKKENGCSIKESEKDSNVFLNLAVIGFLEEIKGQDILLESIKNLDIKVRQKIRLYIIGQDNTLYGNELKKEYLEVNNVIYMGVLERLRVHEMLEQIDVLICPSRQDSMPTVVAEAMMHSKPCIISDAVGTRRYINDEVNGLIFASERSEELSKKILWCLNNKEKLHKIGENAKKTYNEFFSRKAFEKEVLMLVSGELK